jgi:hypothetical protein
LVVLLTNGLVHESEVLSPTRSTTTPDALHAKFVEKY